MTVAGAPATKPAALVAQDAAVRVEPGPRRFVSRGGEKLAAALSRFAIDPGGRDCLDAGASTGGFTDCLLKAGAAGVIAVDVGYGQLAWALRADPRVTVLERSNVRHLVAADLPFAPEVVVADLSFISLSLAVPVLAGLAAPGATFVLLVKPQFEVGRDRVGRGGVVRDPAAWRDAIERVADACAAAGATPLDVMACPIPGPAGNVEFLLHARGGARGARLETGRAVDEGRALL